MDMQKATEIVESLGVMGVTYNGNPVWIESLHEESNEAEIKDLKSGKKHIVSISELSED